MSVYAVFGQYPVLTDDGSEGICKERLLDCDTRAEAERVCDFWIRVAEQSQAAEGTRFEVRLVDRRSGEARPPVGTMTKTWGPTTDAEAFGR